MEKFTVNGLEVGGPDCYIIAEIGQAHDGSLGSAHAYIDAVAQAGANAVKFQTHIASEESTKHEQFRVRVFPQDETRYEYWKRMEFTKEQWKGLYEHAQRVGLDFLSTPFSAAAVELLEELNVPAYKIGSGDTGNTALLEAVAKTGKPVLLSSGMSSFVELEESFASLKATNSLGLFQCTTSYPCPAEEIGYNVIDDLASRFQCPIGLSDHSGKIYPSLAAVARGAKMIEVHAVFSKRCFGPDTSSSLTIEELTELVEGVRFIEKGLNCKIDKSLMASNRQETKVLFSRSAFCIKELNAGEILTEAHFAMKKPGGGLSIEEARNLIGKKVTKNLGFDDYICVGDFQ
ncbi:N-acetylneuraminate synthase family protein [Enterovibrio makurazakiensis]|uniref:N-acetylneuraminate synthase family protein n=1 Tax=Enterovibrio makurazakiensis TaxID=2910232 RepID=UPI003D22182F